MRPARVSSPSEVETLRQMRALVRSAIGTKGVEAAAQLAGCSPQTLTRILRGRNVHVCTVVRVLDAFGYRLKVDLVKVGHLSA